MKKTLALLGLSFFYIFVSAQPTSFGGITPGKTTLVELRGLVTEQSEFLGVFYAILKNPAGQKISLLAVNGVIYDVRATQSDQLKSALLAKYGEPTIKVGEVKLVNCSTRSGTSQQYEAEVSLLWPVKDGVQAGFEYRPKECGPGGLSESFVLRHAATYEALKSIAPR